MTAAFLFRLDQDPAEAPWTHAIASMQSDTSAYADVQQDNRCSCWFTSDPVVMCTF